MTSTSSTTSPVVRVAIDVAKLTHQVLLELPSGQRRAMRVANTKAEIDRFVATLRALRPAVRDRVRADRRLPSAAGLRPRAGRLSSLRWCPRSRSPARERRCTTRGTRTIRKTRRSFCIC